MLSEAGMNRYTVSCEPEEFGFAKISAACKHPVQNEIIRHRWKAENIKIAVAGAQRRCGTTMTAFNLAAWLAARGAEVCYAEANANRHLNTILSVYDAVKAGEHYAIGGIDFYLTETLDRDYNFIIYDCGELTSLRPAFTDAEKRILCGSVLPYELSVFSKAASLCKNLSVEKVGICVPEEMLEYCENVFGDDFYIVESSRSLFDSRVNSRLYNDVIKEYIAD